MKLKNQIELLNNTLKLHDEKVDEHFPKDESKVPAYAKAQYMDLFSMLQEIAKAYEFTARWHKASVKAIEILVTNINEHSEMVNEIMEDTDYENWTKEEEEHYTGVFYYDLHRTVEETIEEMEEA
ncbi:hypothetical protein CHPC1161_000109 [Lactococcus phage CHPC1161]|uniref:Uncharacterized protein n=1 Tax=Lactococcus phage CHPC1161 TaxID=2675239 RepID=A0A650F6U9_9CAUD|nr:MULTISPECIES: hypothetical protein [Bacillales]QGT52455.1 hypothetical protein CHPC1161_000109 [Lactococcus phage CHPC1161]RAP17553.1 hypothetical protein C2W59_02356 [Bacillus pumilus]RAP20678.1 hypothetical protein C2W64_03847 [Brevibacillus laterosporus]